MNKKTELHEQVVKAISEYENDLTQINTHYPFINEVVYRIITNRMSWDGQITYDIKDIRLSLVYLINFSLPVLECLGLLDKNSIDDAVYWGTIQLNFGLYLRYVDYSIDNDYNQQSSLSQTLYTYAYLNNAIELLANRGNVWSTKHREMFMHHLYYEHNIASDNHNMSRDDVWKRVSPLCIIISTWNHTDENLGEANLKLYELYLTCALLSSDCDDAIEDFYHKRRTFITEHIKKSMRDNYMSATELQKIVLQWRIEIESQYSIILNTIENNYPLWYIILKKFITEDSTERFFYIRRL
jgi:hypothetical protein